MVNKHYDELGQNFSRNTEEDLLKISRRKIDILSQMNCTQSQRRAQSPDKSRMAKVYTNIDYLVYTSYTWRWNFNSSICISHPTFPTVYCSLHLKSSYKQSHTISFSFVLLELLYPLPLDNRFPKLERQLSIYNLWENQLLCKKITESYFLTDA